MQEMMRYNWPGNIREREHVIERCVILSQTKLIDELNLPDIAKNKTAVASREFVLKTWEE
jgi:DNA-binding NtrC family response regulator